MEESTQVEITENKKPILVVFGKHEYIVENAERLLKAASFETVGFVSLEETMTYLRANTVDGTLIGGGVDPHDRLALVNMIKEEFPAVKVIEHFGGPATIVPEVQKAMAV